MEPETSATVPSTTRPRMLFMFTGQGAQYASMGRGLYESVSSYKAAFDGLATIALSEHNINLVEMLNYGSLFGSSKGSSEIDVHETKYTQPLVFAIQVSLVEMWRSVGINPDAVIGHSLGEFAAAVCAGLLDARDGLALVVRRGELMDSLPCNGGMLAVFKPEMEAVRIVNTKLQSLGLPELHVACVNNPTMTVLSGATESVHVWRNGIGRKRKRSAALEGDVRCQKLLVSHAFHSPLMLPMTGSFEVAVRECFLRKADCGLAGDLSARFMSTVHPGWLDRVSLQQPRYWVDQIVLPVRFEQAIHKIAAEASFGTVLEIGPSPHLTNMAKLALDVSILGAEHVPSVWAVSLLAPSKETGMRDDVAAMEDALLAITSSEWAKSTNWFCKGIPRIVKLEGE